MSSTFVAKVVSYSWMIYGCMIAVIEVCKLTKWTYPFTVFGKNALPVYVLANVLDILMRNVTICNTPSGSPISTLDWFYQHVCVAIFGNNAAASLCYAIIFLLLMWLVALLFYRRKVFIKV
jgi:predicted acyltransferase